MGVGPLIAWRRASAENLKRNFLCAGGDRPRSPPPCCACSASAPCWCWSRWRSRCSSPPTITVDLVRATRARRTMGERPLAALGGLLRRHNRRYGGFIVHLGHPRRRRRGHRLPDVVGAHRDHAQARRAGRAGWLSHPLRRPARRARSPTTARSPGPSPWSTAGPPAPCCSPAKKFYPQEQSPIAYVDYRLGLIDDIYVVLGDFARDGTSATVKLQINRMVSWIWIGGLVLTLGTLLAVLPEPGGRPRDASLAMAVAADGGAAAGAARLRLPAQPPRHHVAPGRPAGGELRADVVRGASR